ncbi:MAG: hypothetical protein WC718_00385 [Phycisphaerales bacterium]|jgi:hypothetical protein
MTKERAKHLLPVLQAIIDGKPVRHKSFFKGSPWQDLPEEMGTLYADHRYEVKPEPREFWVVTFAEGLADTVHRSRADAYDGQVAHWLECIHVREVAEEETPQ